MRLRVRPQSLVSGTKRLMAAYAFAVQDRHNGVLPPVNRYAIMGTLDEVRLQN